MLYKHQHPTERSQDMKQPIGFKTDSGRWFDIDILRYTPKRMWILLKGANNTIKIRRNDRRLRYEREEV